jgi:hypothetical protein
MSKKIKDENCELTKSSGWVDGWVEVKVDVGFLTAIKNLNYQNNNLSNELKLEVWKLNKQF